MATLTCARTKEGGRDWRPARKNDTVHLYAVEYAKTGRARCRRCSEMIPNKVIRVSVPCRHTAGAYGWIDGWQCLRCSRADPSVYFDDGLGEDDEGDEQEDKDAAKKKNNNSKAAAAASAAQAKKKSNNDKNENDEVIAPSRKKFVAFLSRHIYGLSDLSSDADIQNVLEELSDPVRPEHLAELEPDDLVKRGKLPQMEPPASILQHLLPHQKEGLGWMVNQEANSGHKGGILADEMGMGKTITTICLIAARKGVAPTLIVAPVSAIMQWQEEIMNHVAPDELKVAVLTSTAKGKNKAALERIKNDLLLADVVLTTYPVLEHSWRALVDDTKVKCKYCKHMFTPKKLAFHNKYFCGPDAKRTDKQKKQLGDKDDSTPSTTTTTKDGAKGGGNKKVQSMQTIKKGMRTLGAGIDVDEDLDSDDDDADGSSNNNSSTAMQKRNTGGVLGPMSMYAELMNEAGRTVRSRFDPARIESDSDDEEDKDKDKSGPAAPKNSAAAAPAAKGKRASPKAKPKQKRTASRHLKEDDDDDDETSSSSASSSSSDDDETSSDEEGATSSSGDDDDDSDSAKKTNSKKATAKKTATSKKKTVVAGKGGDGDDADAAKQARIDAAIAAAQPPDNCAACGLLNKSRPFCPKTGAAHPKPLSKSELERFQSGMELRALPDEGEADTGADDNVKLENSVLHSIVWHRVVLDEAHRIKGRNTSTTRAALALRAGTKWCLTGTPLQNRVGDLYSLLRFLRMAPFARHFCGVEGCKCSTLAHPFSSDNTSNFCVYCGHSPLQHYSHFNRHIMNPIQRYGYVGEGRKAMLLLAGSVLQHIMLRRTKAERAEDLRLPPCTVELRYIEQTAAERDFYESLYKKSAAKFDTFVKKGTLLHNYAHIFQLLSRLRQALDHPYLVLYSDTGSTATMNAEKQQQQQKDAAAAAADKVKQNNTNNDRDDDDPFAVAAANMGLASLNSNNKTNTAASPAEMLMVNHLPAAAAVPSEVCGICMESTDAASRVLVRPCRHAFHRLCLMEFIESCPEANEDDDEDAAAANDKNKKDNKNDDDLVDEDDEDQPLIARLLAKAAPAAKKGKVAAKKPAAKAKKAGGKQQQDKKTKKKKKKKEQCAIQCPRCFVPIHVDLQNLAAAVMGGVNSDDEDDDDEDNDEQMLAGTEEAAGSGQRRQRGGGGGGKKKPAASSAAKKAAAPQEQRQQQNGEDDDDDNIFGGQFGGAFAMSDFAAVQAPGDDGAPAAAAAGDRASAADNGNNKNSSNIPKSAAASTLLRKIDTSKFVGSTKLDAIIAAVLQIHHAKGEKTIVFSQFGAMLDIIEFALERARIRTVKLVGSMAMSSRLASLRAFRTEPSVAVILISLKAGGEGLNLQIANNVILADLWWSPAVEQQAIQRAHRIGQTRPVTAIRFVTRNTVEERMMELQTKKAAVADGVIDNKFDALQRLSEDDLRFLFTG